MTDLWPRLEALLGDAERPARYINREWGCVYKPDADFRFCMVYPDTYELGQANQAVRILVNAVNAADGMAAERAFLPAPAFCDTMRDEGLPLFSIESCAPVAEFDVVGITLPRSTQGQGYMTTSRVDRENLSRGDLVCFDTEADDDLSDCVGIYLGDGQFIHASASAGEVVISPMDEGEYGRTFSWGIRPLQ